jgi:hypothetical protein
LWASVFKLSPTPSQRLSGHVEPLQKVYLVQLMIIPQFFQHLKALLSHSFLVNDINEISYLRRQNGIKLVEIQLFNESFGTACRLQIGIPDIHLCSRRG